MPREPKKPDTVPLMVRLPADLHAALVHRADDEERSMNAQLIVILRAALKPPPSGTAAGPKAKRAR